MKRRNRRKAFERLRFFLVRRDGEANRLQLMFQLDERRHDSLACIANPVDIREVVSARRFLLRLGKMLELFEERQLRLDSRGVVGERRGQFLSRHTDSLADEGPPAIWTHASRSGMTSFRASSNPSTSAFMLASINRLEM